MNSEKIRRACREIDEKLKAGDLRLEAVYQKGLMDGSESRQLEINELEQKIIAYESLIDDVQMQENQSLKEQLKIMKDLFAKYNPDIDMPDFMHCLATEDYQEYLINNEIDQLKKDKAELIEALGLTNLAMLNGEIYTYELTGKKVNYIAEENTKLLTRMEEQS